MLATAQSSDSWIWKGVLKATNNIWPELCWHIGNGESVDYWLEPWIMGIRFGRPAGPPHISWATTRVADLIWLEGRTWKMHLILNLFHLDIAHRIISIPLSKYPTKDTLRWTPEMNDILAVKSVHNHTTPPTTSTTPDPFLANRSGLSWDFIWKLQVPFRLQLFLWKAIHNGILTKFNLWQGNEDWDTNYPRCDTKMETTAHALFFCPKIRDIWYESDLNIEFRLTTYSDSLLDIFHRCFLLSRNDSNISLYCRNFCSIMYAIWMSRNLLIFEQKNQNPKEIVKHTKHLRLNDLPAPVHRSRPPPYLPPIVQEGWHIIQVDASRTTQGNLRGTGFTIRNHLTSVLCAGYGHARATDSEEAEAIAVIRGLEAAQWCGLSRVLLLTDCQRLVKAFRDRSDDLTWGALTLAPDLRALSDCFIDFRFEHIDRSCNFEVHCLAARGLRLRATTSEETSTSIIEYSEETSDVVKTVETAPVEEEPKEEPFVEEQVPVFEFLDNLDFKVQGRDWEEIERDEEDGSNDKMSVMRKEMGRRESDEDEEEEGQTDGTNKLLCFLNNSLLVYVWGKVYNDLFLIPDMEAVSLQDMLTVTFKNQLNPEDTSSILIYGSSVLVTLWLASAVIGAIDSIPVVPKALELVGLGYTIWFSSRYLILKKNRDELLSKVEEFKQQIMGSNDEQL
ncbi:hypothetical protein GIB67_019622 [Kingdonia uniflora]|uniref:Uncharacterized protein n=1 Tax=Kingdonia uniflora TaxID=39325 RepID=A0A7J7N106_9MAGN|nr:hypothetical protein GIB67_019622 [Kingdonia uniflora]